MLDEHYVNPRLARLYDLDSPWSVDRQFYFDLPAAPATRVLDVGCGTGLIAAALAQAGHLVTGVDPASEMLKVARARPGGERVEWVQGAAEKLGLSAEFDLIIMTGNAFQALLEVDQLAGFLRGARRCMSGGGKLVFETRNPEIDWPSRWNYEIELETPDGSVRERRRFLELKGDRMTFELIYEFPDERLVSKSTLRFWTKEEVLARIRGVGLRLGALLGDYEGRELDPGHSQEMVFVVEQA